MWTFRSVWQREETEMVTEDRDQSQIGLGTCLQVFKPSIGNIVAGFILSVLAVTGGCAVIVCAVRMAYLANWNLPVYIEKGSCWVAVGLLVLVGVFLIGMGIFLSVFSKGLISNYLEICENGYRYHSKSGHEEVLWADIRHIKETILYERLPILKGPAKLLLPKISSQSYQISTPAGNEHAFNGTSLNEIKKFGEILRTKADELSLSWETVEEHG
jgi:hypothetical protein